MLAPEVITEYGQLSGKPLFIHRNRGYDNLICQDESGYIFWFPRGNDILDERLVFTLNDDERILNVQSVGNTLIFLTDQRTEYVLYKVEDGFYLDLGDQIPIPNVRFWSINQQRVKSDVSGVSSSKRVAATNLLSRLSKLNADYEMVTSEDRSSGSSHSGGSSSVRRTQVSTNVYERLGFTERESDADMEKVLKSTLWEEVNAGISAVKKQGSMCTPVFVRAALKLYDNTYIYQTVPVLLGANKDEFFSASFLANKKSTGSKWDSWISIEYLNAYLPMAMLESFSYVGWEDIITSIDLFMSTDIHYPRIDSKWSELTEVETNDSDRIRFDVSFHSEDEEEAAEKLLNEVLSKRVFYKVRSFAPDKFKRLSDGYMMLEDEDIRSQDYLVTQSTLDDDYLSFHKRTAENAFQYNNCLIINGITTQLYSGYPFLNGEVLTGGGEGQPDLSLQDEWRMQYIFHLKDGSNKELTVLGRNTDGGYDFRPIQYDAHYVIRRSAGSTEESDNESITITAYGRAFAWLAYPDTRCYKVDVKMLKYNDGVVTGAFICSYDMTPHPGLNCSYVFIGFGKRIGLDGADMSLNTWDDTEVKTYKEDNVLWASKMGNPFFFPKEGRLSFSANVIAVAAATKPLTDGQGGRFLFAFTGSGIWGIPINDEGEFAAIWFLTRDVLLSKDSLCCLEQSVVFVTSQGVMMLVGMNVQNISPGMNGPHFVIDEPVREALAADEVLGPFREAFSDSMPFNSFTEGAKIAYDYISRRLIFFRSDKAYQYMYMLDSGTWHKQSIEGLMLSIVDNINSFPDCYVCALDDTSEFVNTGYRLLSLSLPYDASKNQSALPGLIITRPMSFDSDDIRKVLKKVSIRGKKNRDDVKYILLASMDGLSWQRLRSLHGGSYKWFRLVLLSNLSPAERISWIDIEFDTRFTNRLR